MTFWILVGLGGAAGAVARYAVAGWVYDRAGTAFPWGTVAVNVIGSFLLGLVLTGLADGPFEVQIGALLAIGFLGDFTTFSTYSYETLTLVRERRWTRALLYQLGSVGLALLAVVAGMVCGEILRP